jgi:mono/diheme cytochrome c family protein
MIQKVQDGAPTSPRLLPALAVLFITVLASGVWLQLDAASQQAAPQAAAPAAASSSQTTAATRPAASAQPSLGVVVGTYCVGCHNAEKNTGGLDLESVDWRDVAASPAIWEKVATKLRTREMPPSGRTRPDLGTYDRMVAHLESTLDAAAAANPSPGRVPVHRLSRAEYAAAIRDLLRLEIDAEALLSADEADLEGFDNVASVLSVSPALLENYLAAARRISRLAVGDLAIVPGFESTKISKQLVQDEQMSDDLPFGSRGGAVVRHYFPVDGEYVIKVQLRRQEYDYIVGLGEPHQIDFRIDGVRVQRLSIGGEAKGRTMPESYIGNTQGDPEFEVYMQTADAKLEARVPVKAGLHDVGVSFVRRHWEPEGVWQPPIIGFGRATNELYHGNPAVEVLMIGGPYGKTAPGDSAVRRRVFTCTPTDPASEEPCARKILSAIATRAYRRPVTDADLGRVLEFYRAGRTEGGSFDAGIQRGLERILASPNFLFRVEQPPAGARPGAPYRLNDYDLASRLSFFLWGSIPDDELLNLAGRGKLKEPAVIEQQVRRLLRDPRSTALVNNFAARWLELGKLTGVVPDTDLYREFDENLRHSMEQETKLFIEDQIRNDRNVLDLITADYSFINQRLATHYGVPNIYGDHFRRVTFTDGRRGGLLGQASLLAITSYPNRTSVVLRGRWVLANLLGAPPPAPPPDVPALQEAGANGAPRSLRERMEVHRSNAVCASCHRRMDPLGFALENFDATGKWRTSSDGVPVDSTASLPDGTTFDGVNGLRTMIASRREEFVRAFTAKLLSYSVGRGLEGYDAAAIRKIVRQAAASDYRWSAVIAGIVESTPFSMSIAPGSPADRAAPRVESRNR